MEDYNTLENKWEKNKHRKKLMNEPIIEIPNADKVINKMTSGKVPTDDITKIRCFDCKKEIKEGEFIQICRNLMVKKMFIKARFTIEAHFNSCSIDFFKNYPNFIKIAKI